MKIPNEAFAQKDMIFGELFSSPKTFFIKRKTEAGTKTVIGSFFGINVLMVLPSLTEI